MTSTRRQPWALGLLGAALGLALVLVAATSTRGGGWGNVGLAVTGFALVWVVAVQTWRYPAQRRLATLLFALAGTAWFRGLAIADDALVYSLARAVGPLAEALLVWVMLAFPSGRLRSRHDRALVAGAVATVVLLWWPTVLLSSSIPLKSALAACGTDCPRNALQVWDQPDLAVSLLRIYTVAGAVILALTALILADRLRRASAVARQALAPVLAASIVRALAVVAFLLSGGSILATPALTVTFWAVPVAIEAGLLRRRLYSAKALQRLVAGLRTRPTASQLRRIMSEALDDPTLELYYRVPNPSGSWVRSDGTPAALPVPTVDRAVAWVAEPNGALVAALALDPALGDDPELVDAVTSSTHVVLRSYGLEAELAGSRSDAHAVTAEVRRRIERDLHDGAQQRLIAIRMKLSVVDRLLEKDLRRATELVRELGSDVDAALSELRRLAHGDLPAGLVEQGLPAALQRVAERMPLAVVVDAQGIGRYPAPIEENVYFCCLEALQNVIRHAGPDAKTRVLLHDDGWLLTFSVTDDGLGATPGPPAGQGLANMRERMQSISGELSTGPGAEGGFSVTGRVPVS